MKTINKQASPAVISTNSLRFEFHRVLKAVKAGQTLTVTYRNKPLARIVPLSLRAAVPQDDPLFRLGNLAEAMGGLTNQEIDRLIYGT